MDRKSVKFVAVGRTSDKVLIGSAVVEADPGVDFEQRAQTVLERGRWDTLSTDRLSLEDGGNLLVLFMDTQKRVYMAIVSKNYPTRHLFPEGKNGGLLGEIRDLVQSRYDEVTLTGAKGALPRAGLKALADVATKYNDLKNVDTIARVAAKVEDVKGVMRDNIDKALTVVDKATETGDKTAKLADSALEFKRGGAALERKMRCRYYKLTCLAVLLVLVIIGYFVIPLIMPAASSSSSDSGDSGGSNIVVPSATPSPSAAAGPL